VPTKRTVVTEQLGNLGQDLKQLWVAVTTDPKKQARKQRMWSVVSGILAAGATMAARRSTSRAWAILTGEQPPLARGPGR
jgi:uncharacterized membrane-anchored protein